MVYYSVPVVCSLPAEYCDSAVGRFRDILRSTACHAGSFLRIGILGILSIHQTDKKQVAFYPLLFPIYECQCAERHPLSEKEKRKRSLGKGEARRKVKTNAGIFCYPYRRHKSLLSNKKQTWTEYYMMRITHKEY